MLTKIYHTHNYRCKHATGDVIDYCKAAEKNGITVLGISDHTPLPDNRWNFERMDYSELSSYVISMENAKSLYSHITILKAMECDYIEEYRSFYKDELLGKYNLDYLIGAVHWFLMNDEWIRVPGEIKDKQSLKAYAEHYIKAIESGLYLFMAHPDIFGIFYPIWDSQAEEFSKEILKAAEDRAIPLEINTHGYRKSFIQTEKGLKRKYPLRKFWELAANYKIQVVISTDAHNPEDLIKNLDDAFKIVSDYNLELTDFKFLE